MADEKKTVYDLDVSDPQKAQGTARAIQSLVVQKAGLLLKAGVVQMRTEAMDAAYDLVGRELVRPPIDGKALASWVMRWIGGTRRPIINGSAKLPEPEWVEAPRVFSPLSHVEELKRLVALLEPGGQALQWRFRTKQEATAFSHTVTRACQLAEKENKWATPEGQTRPYRTKTFPHGREFLVRTWRFACNGTEEVSK